MSTCQPLYQQLSGPRAAPISSLIINCQPHYQHLLAAVSEPVNRLLCTCQQLDQRLTLSTQLIEKQRLNRVNIIFQPVDLCLLSPAVSAYTAARSELVSRLTSTCQLLDQHLSAD